MSYDWYASEEKDNGDIEVFAGWGEHSLQDFVDFTRQGLHSHFRIEPGKEEISGRPGPNRGNPEDWYDPPSSR